MTDHEETTVLTPDRSSLSVSIVAILLTSVAGGAAWAASVTHRLSNIEAALLRGTVDRWTGGDMEGWVEQSNREIRVWSLGVERLLDMPPGSWSDLELPKPKRNPGPP